MIYIQKKFMFVFAIEEEKPILSFNPPGMKSEV
jgi:hypothetical protein